MHYSPRNIILACGHEHLTHFDGIYFDYCQEMGDVIFSSNREEGGKTNGGGSFMARYG